MDITRFRFKTLQARLLVLLLIPVVVILLAGGVASFWYARGIMLDQWNESAVIKLQRAAHYIEMRLLKPVDLLNALFQASERNAAVVSPEQVTGFLQVMEGVVSAEYDPADISQSFRNREMPGMGHMDRMNADMQPGMWFSRSKIASVSGPSYQAGRDGQTVTMRITLSGPSEEILGHLVISMQFDYLLKDILAL